MVCSILLILYSILSQVSFGIKIKNKAKKGTLCSRQVSLFASACVYANRCEPIKDLIYDQKN